MRTLHELLDRGQSPWYDNLSRTLIESGELAQLVEQGIVGVTSNPTIFDQAISSSNAYDSALQACKQKGLSPEETYWDLVCTDIADAADILKPIYEKSMGRDGYVSVEVSPLLARSTAETIAQANELFARIGRDNVMIKIPATQECVESIRAVLANAIPVNVTLIFSQERYADVISAYKSAIASLTEQGVTDLPQSVASFFISRLDTKVDPQLEAGSHLLGTGAVSNAVLAYKMFEDSFDEQTRNGAQRPLWASTGTKNPEYSKTLYVDELIAPNTVNTLPHATIDAIIESDTSFPDKDLTASYDDAESHWKEIMAEVDIDTVMKELENEGVTSFENSYRSCLESIESRLANF